jgi:hypothetical protein
MGLLDLCAYSASEVDVLKILNTVYIKPNIIFQSTYFATPIIINVCESTILK